MTAQLPFVHLHYSGRWDRTPADMMRDLNRFEAEHHVVLETITEVANDQRAGALDTPGWSAINSAHPDLDDCALRWHDGTFARLHTETVPLSLLEYRKANGARADLVAACTAVLWHMSGGRLLVIVAHLPPTIEGPDGFQANQRARVAKDATKRLLTYAGDMAAKHDCDAVLISADWNLNLRLAWVRRWFAAAFQGLRLTWSQPYPAAGTHGRRIIDAALVRGLRVVRRPQLLRTPSSDHRAFVQTLQITKENTMPRPQHYPPADRNTQWFADNFRGVTFDANCGVLHTTESSGWPSYDGGAKAPNLTARPDFARKRLLWRQHFPIDMSSRALRNEDGGVETNTLNTIQVELIGTCDPKHRKSWNGDGELLAGRDYLFWPDAPDWALRDLAAFMRWCKVEHGVPLTGPGVWLPYPSSFGATSARFTFAEWRAFKGWCGHQHVPENSHGDPGNINFTRILEHARGVQPQPPVVKVTLITEVRDAIPPLIAKLTTAAGRDKAGVRKTAILAGRAALNTALTLLPRK